MPPTTTLSAADCPDSTVAPVGCLLMTGAVHRLRVAVRLSLEPQEFVTRTQNRDVALIGPVLKLVEVAPAAGELVSPLNPRNHWKETAFEAATERVTDSPAFTVRDCGCWVIEGRGQETVTVAILESTSPQLLLTRTEYVVVVVRAGVVNDDAMELPVVGEPPWNHWYARGAVPVAVTDNVVVEPDVMVLLVGCAVMAGHPEPPTVPSP